ncbi:MAG: single-stranded-DNA-specific exonuclease RecJ [Pseudomonadota bacterium]
MLVARPVDPSLPLVERLYAARHASVGERDVSLGRLLPPDQLPDIDRAAERIARAVQADERMVVVGDFDADGATAVAVSLLLLQGFGATRVSYLVPDRFRFGYGLSPEIAALAVADQPGLLITVDNGVSSIDGVRVANAAGVDVIVTDHHLPAAELPAACAVVNPVLAGSTFASPALAGVGVVYYTLARVRQVLRGAGWFENRVEPNVAAVLDLVALGTVADVVPLDFNNRVLVAQGLKRIRAGRCRPGILALLSVARRDHRRLTAEDLGFAVGPRLNAAGRLDDMSVGIQCLLAADQEAAHALTLKLDALNRERRDLQASMVATAEQHAAIVTADPDVVGVCVYEPDWHQGVVGLVAGKLKEKLHKPVIAFARTDAGSSQLKGSARSIPGLHIRDVLDSIAARRPGLIKRFGGHAMAAGLEIDERFLKTFANAFDTAVRAVATEEQLTRVLLTDGSLTAQERNLEVARELRDAGPWGQGFPEPLFTGEFEVISQRVVGTGHLKLLLGSDDQVLDAIAFNQEPVAGKRVLAAYRLSENAYQGQTTLQLMVEHLSSLP